MIRNSFLIPDFLIFTPENTYLLRKGLLYRLFSVDNLRSVYEEILSQPFDRLPA